MLSPETTVTFRGVSIRAYRVGHRRALSLPGLDQLSRPLHPGFNSRLSEYVVRGVPKAERDTITPKFTKRTGSSERTITLEGVPYLHGTQMVRFDAVDDWARDPELIRLLSEPIGLENEPQQPEPTPEPAQPTAESPTALLPVERIGDELRVDSRLIAAELGVDHASVLALLDTYLSDFEEFGVVRFQILRIALNSTQLDYQVRVAPLNDAQATLLLTYSKNTAPARAFKRKLIRTFEYYRELAAQKLNGAADIRQQLFGAHDNIVQLRRQLREHQSSSEATLQLHKGTTNARFDTFEQNQHEALKGVNDSIHERMQWLEANIAALHKEQISMKQTIELVELERQRSLTGKAAAYIVKKKDWRSALIPIELRAVPIGYPHDEAFRLFGVDYPSETYPLSLAKTLRNEIEDFRRKVFLIETGRILGKILSDEQLTDPDQEQSWDYLKQILNNTLLNLERKIFNRDAYPATHTYSLVTCWFLAGLAIFLKRAIENWIDARQTGKATFKLVKLPLRPYPIVS